jgi:hypothetical protein
MGQPQFANLIYFTYSNPAILASFTDNYRREI